MDPSAIEAGDVIEATFNPQRTDDLTPAAAAIVGQRFQWTCVRRVEDNGPDYDGQWRLELGKDDCERTGLWWVALCDLSDIVYVGRDQRAADEYRILNGL
ncbi:hypothetical protein [Mycobacterium botniense]|uniref:Uncharacterized protein n=1 Tax=Mycobacterium botniense TaxID=84962 RepID=A0A7I9XXW6_9MYCO|nr:hypothetical protein [Mycobacterium botniense]GFG74623.1 hypothetical protein MBOT_19880 [Mycobacterium botniense]GFG74666.1 hypothetical protein MBOT_20310 [Mycobacterium botniense]